MSGTGEKVLRFIIPLIYARRWLTFSVLIAVTVFLAWHGAQLKPDAGFEKQIPLSHPYMKVFKDYEKAFGGANLISIALIQKNSEDGLSSGRTIYEEKFLDRLKKLTDATFFLPGVDRTRVSSLFTPDLTYLEIVEGGLNFGNIVPRNYRADAETLRTIRDHVEKSGVIGRYVSSDQRGAMIVGELLEHHPVTGEKLNYHRLATQIEDQLRRRLQSPVMYEYRLLQARAPYEAGDVIWRGYTDYGWRLRYQRFEAPRADGDGNAVVVTGKEVEVSQVQNPDYAPDIDVHIIGFAKVIGDVTDASTEVVSYFFIALVLVFGLLWLFCGSFRLSLLPLSAALVAVIWEQGLLQLCGFGLDPFAILVPFLIMSIGVSHGVQYINAWGRRSRKTASVPLMPASKLSGDCSCPARSPSSPMSSASPPWRSSRSKSCGDGDQRGVGHGRGHRHQQGDAADRAVLGVVARCREVPSPSAGTPESKRPTLGAYCRPSPTARWALSTLGVATVALGWALWMYPKLTIGDSQVGVPELRPDSRYNRDSIAVVSNFAIGVDVLKVIAETGEYGCVNPQAMEAIDRFTWRMQNKPGVQSAISIASDGTRSARPVQRRCAQMESTAAQRSRAVATGRTHSQSRSVYKTPTARAMPVFIFTARPPGRNHRRHHRGLKTVQRGERKTVA